MPTLKAQGWGIQLLKPNIDRTNKCNSVCVLVMYHLAGKQIYFPGRYSNIWMFNSDVACQECKYFYMMIYNIRSFPGFFPQTFCTKNTQFSSTHTEMNPIVHVSSTGIEGRYNKIFCTKKLCVEMPIDMWDIPNSFILFNFKALYAQVSSSQEIKCSNSDALSYTSPSVLWFSRMYCKTLNHGCTAWCSRG